MKFTGTLQEQAEIPLDILEADLALVCSTGAMGKP